MPTEAPTATGPFSKSRYRFTSGVRAGEVVTVRDGDGEPLFTYRSFANTIGIVALVVSVIVAVSGTAAVLFLVFESRPLPAIMALLLSAAFAIVIAMLVPPTHVTLYDDAAPVLHIAQEGNLSFPVASFVVGTPEQHVIAHLRKTVWSRLGRNRWEIRSANDKNPIGSAAEESMSRAMLRKIAGKFNRRYESNVRLRYLGKNVGWIIRRPDASGEVDVLDLAGDIDHRVAVALATLILGSEP